MLKTLQTPKPGKSPPLSQWFSSIMYFSHSRTVSASQSSALTLQLSHSGRKAIIVALSEHTHSFQCSKVFLRYVTQHLLNNYCFFQYKNRLAPKMINPWLRWKVQGLFLLGKDLCSQVKSHAKIKKLQHLTIFRIRIIVQLQMKIKMCFHHVKMFTLLQVLIATFNSLSL